MIKLDAARLVPRTQPMKDNNQKKMVWHVACDESGVDGQPFYGFGSLWMSYQRRTELTPHGTGFEKKAWMQ